MAVRLHPAIDSGEGFRRVLLRNARLQVNEKAGQDRHQRRSGAQPRLRLYPMLEAR